MKEISLVPLKYTFMLHCSLKPLGGPHSCVKGCFSSFDITAELLVLAALYNDYDFPRVGLPIFTLNLLKRPRRTLQNVSTVSQTYLNAPAFLVRYKPNSIISKEHLITCDPLARILSSLSSYCCYQSRTSQVEL